MSIPPEALQKVLEEIETRAVQSQLELNGVKQQIDQKRRDIRLAELRLSQLDGVTDTVWEGVGKMFMKVPVGSQLDKLKKEKKDAEDAITQLSKKLNYLETTYNNAKKSLEEVLGRRA
ncbi:putative Prefoldin subunit 1 [Dipodascopsis tothii]|uniref:putative Prefoldin subunit 1 n=1 Tax=Dipodascopsis tothii TaxID=44089 RepID=UPI0034CE74B1